MRKTYYGDKVLFERGRWLIIDTSIQYPDSATIWMVHRCDPKDDAFNRVKTYYGPEFHNKHVIACKWCGRSASKEVQTVYRLLQGHYSDKAPGV